MSIAAIVGLALALLLAAVLIAASATPGAFALERGMDMQATPDRIFPWIDDLRAHAAWSPFATPHSKLRKRCAGPANGVGATVEWNGKCGNGHLRLDMDRVVGGQREHGVGGLKSCAER